MSESNWWYALAVAVWGAVAGAGWAIIRGGNRQPSPSEPLPPGYGERYHYREMFAEDMAPDELDCSLLAPMPEDHGAEPTNVIEAYQRFTACRVCGFRRRVCSSEACPQRRFLP